MSLQKVICLLLHQKCPVAQVQFLGSPNSYTHRNLLYCARLSSRQTSRCRSLRRCHSPRHCLLHCIICYNWLGRLCCYCSSHCLLHGIRSAARLGRRGCSCRLLGWGCLLARLWGRLWRWLWRWLWRCLRCALWRSYLLSDLRVHQWAWGRLRLGRMWTLGAVEHQFAHAQIGAVCKAPCQRSQIRWNLQEIVRFSSELSPKGNLEGHPVHTIVRDLKRSPLTMRRSPDRPVNCTVVIRRNGDCRDLCWPRKRSNNAAWCVACDASCVRAVQKRLFVVSRNLSPIENVRAIGQTKSPQRTRILGLIWTVGCCWCSLWAVFPRHKAWAALFYLPRGMVPVSFKKQRVTNKSCWLNCIGKLLPCNQRKSNVLE